jgi:hypothetical protein
VEDNPSQDQSHQRKKKKEKEILQGDRIMSDLAKGQNEATKDFREASNG